MTQLRPLLAIAITLCLGSSCQWVEDPDGLSIARITTNPANGTVDVKPGQTVTLNVQALDEDDEPVDEATLFVATEADAPIVLGPPVETVSASANLATVETGRHEVAGVRVHGIAPLAVTVSEDATPGSTTILVGPTSLLSPESASQPLGRFELTILPPETDEENPIAGGGGE